MQANNYRIEKAPLDVAQLNLPKLYVASGESVEQALSIVLASGTQLLFLLPLMPKGDSHSKAFKE